MREFLKRIDGWWWGGIYVATALMVGELLGMNFGADDYAFWAVMFFLFGCYGAAKERDKK